jgi:hypothetical protein
VAACFAKHYTHLCLVKCFTGKTVLDILDFILVRVG